MDILVVEQIDAEGGAGDFMGRNGGESVVGIKRDTKDAADLAGAQSSADLEERFGAGLPLVVELNLNLAKRFPAKLRPGTQAHQIGSAAKNPRQEHTRAVIRADFVMRDEQIKLFALRGQGTASQGWTMRLVSPAHLPPMAKQYLHFGVESLEKRAVLILNILEQAPDDGFAEEFADEI